ncbi:hypothetical protein D9M71_746820 [compost metagenome]
MNGANTSSISAPLSARIRLRLWSTQEFTTIGRTWYRSPAARILSHASRAFSGSSMNDIRSVMKLNPENWVRRLCPMVSAVIPVPSDT